MVLQSLGEFGNAICYSSGGAPDFSFLRFIEGNTQRFEKRPKFRRGPVRMMDALSLHLGEDDAPSLAEVDHTLRYVFRSDRAH